MNKVSLYFWVTILLLTIWSCESDFSAIDKNVTFPKEIAAPEGIRFSYLMYENDYNYVPQDGNPENYGRKYKETTTSGMYFKFSKKKQFGPGVNGIIGETKVGTWYHVSFSCFKPSSEILHPSSDKGFVVVSFHRKDSTLSYTTYPIEDLLKKENKQMVDKWERLSFWHDVPDDLQAGDRVKIYPWNPRESVLFLEDFTVETWETGTATPKGFAWHHIVTEQNYETSDLAPQTTRETAARGIASCVLSGQQGKAQYGKGYIGSLSDANLQPGDYIKVSFAGLKKHKVRQYTKSASMVLSLDRNGQQLIWDGFPIDSRLWKDGKQTYGEWHRLEFWKQVPENAQPTDILKIYPWNAQPNPIYIDDLLIEVWRKEVLE